MLQAGRIRSVGSGVEVEEGSNNVSPDVITTQTNTVDGVTSTWTGLDLSTKTNQIGCNPRQEQRSNSQSITQDQVFRLIR